MDYLIFLLMIVNASSVDKEFLNTIGIDVVISHIIKNQLNNFVFCALHSA